MTAERELDRYFAIWFLSTTGGGLEKGLEFIAEKTWH
jgi:hypothetical protein